MAALGYLGAVSAYLMWATIRGPLEVFNGVTHVGDRVHVSAGGVVVGLCWLGAVRSLADSDRYLVLYGLVNLVAETGQSVLLSTGVILLWCAWAAVTSTAIAVTCGGLIPSSSVPTQHRRRVAGRDSARPRLVRR